MYEMFEEVPCLLLLYSDGNDLCGQVVPKNPDY